MHEYISHVLSEAEFKSSPLEIMNQTQASNTKSKDQIINVTQTPAKKIIIKSKSKNKKYTRAIGYILSVVLLLCVILTLHNYYSSKTFNNLNKHFI